MNKLRKLFIKLFIYEYKVKIKNLNAEERREVASELWSNNIKFTYGGKHSWPDDWVKQDYIFEFKNEIDAVEFKLRWVL